MLWAISGPITNVPLVAVSPENGSTPSETEFERKKQDRKDDVLVEQNKHTNWYHPMLSV